MSELIEPSTRGTAVGVYRTLMDIGGSARARKKSVSLKF